MKLKACHWGCTKGTIYFRGETAKTTFKKINLTNNEMNLLDSYFNLGVPNESLATIDRCSLPIEISFTLKKGLTTQKTKGVQIYPCTFNRKDVDPLALVDYLTKRSKDIPTWRMSDEEYEKLLILE